MIVIRTVADLAMLLDDIDFKRRNLRTSEELRGSIFGGKDKEANYQESLKRLTNLMREELRIEPDA